MTSIILPNQTNFYQGKVRDVYTIDNHWLVMIASDRISAFDVILPRLIPFKGQVLNQIAAWRFLPQMSPLEKNVSLSGLKWWFVEILPGTHGEHIQQGKKNYAESDYRME